MSPVTALSLGTHPSWISDKFRGSTFVLLPSCFRPAIAALLCLVCVSCHSSESWHCKALPRHPSTSPGYMSSLGSQLLCGLPLAPIQLESALLCPNCVSCHSSESWQPPGLGIFKFRGQLLCLLLPGASCTSISLPKLCLLSQL